MDAFALKLPSHRVASAEEAAPSYFTYLGSDGIQIGYGLISIRREHHLAVSPAVRSSIRLVSAEDHQSRNVDVFVAVSVRLPRFQQRAGQALVRPGARSRGRY